ncbi:hypothetical protein B5S31_g4321 [[Candida] boidinii]|nr:hypothetical protein B5S31_g4321 [[Candida] boidinii]OWB77296.1 hypothetical protein B5S32_g1457 [[Candida] boidinii]
MTKVTVCGAAGGIGQPLSLMLKLNPYIDELSLYDVVNVPGVGTDLGHIDTDTKVSFHLPADENNRGLELALHNSDIVIIPAGVPRKPGMTRDDLFKINAGICKQLAEGIAQFCPNAITLVISNPVNSTVPIFAEVFKKYGVFNAGKLFGITTLDSVRSNTFVAEVAPEKENAPTAYNTRVVGGHSGETIVPLFSVCSPHVYSVLEDDAVDKLVHRVQYAGDEVVAAKNGAGSATLAMAYAGYKFLHAILAAMNGVENIIECSYVNLKDNELPGAKEAFKLINEKFNDNYNPNSNSILENNEISYFSLPILLGNNGSLEIKYDILDKINSKEFELLKICCGTLSKNISKSIDFIST